VVMLRRPVLAEISAVGSLEEAVAMCKRHFERWPG
jgi:hypothetical protein